MVFGITRVTDVLPVFTLAVRVKGGMSLRNGLWHGLRNDIIMRNAIINAEYLNK